MHLSVPSLYLSVLTVSTDSNSWPVLPQVCVSTDRNIGCTAVTAKTPGPASRKALRWEEHKERTRRQLADSARELFAERGYDATSTADIAAAAGVTERTLFRYFPNKIALLLDEIISQLPEMFQLIRERPADEAPYQAVCEGIIEFGTRRRDLIFRLFGRHPVPEVPPAQRQRTLIGIEDALTEVLRQRYARPAEDQITPAVWARASIGALRTALAVTAGHPPADEAPGTPIADTVRACFAALEDQYPPSLATSQPISSSQPR